MSLILKPDIPLSRVYRIAMAVTVALSRAFSIIRPRDRHQMAQRPSDQGTKDLRHPHGDERRGGRLDYAVVGLGINANVRLSIFRKSGAQPPFPTSWARGKSRDDLIQRILLEIEEAYEIMGSSEIYEEWRSRSVTIGR